MPVATKRYPPNPYKPQVDLPDLIDAIGGQHFGAQLMAYLNRSCGAEHSAAFRLHADMLEEVAAASLDGTNTAHEQTNIYLSQQLWRRDPTLWKIQEKLSDRSTALIRTDVSHLSDNDLRNVVYGRTHVCDRVLICARSKDDIVALSILRTDETESFSLADIDRIKSIAGSLLSILNKHVEVTLRGPDVSIALTSLDEIQACIAMAPEGIPRREAEVCSRIIYGVSSIGIAMELGISEETVMTYRKRAYQRLGIATQRELLLWYLSAWSQYRRKMGRPH